MYREHQGNKPEDMNGSIMNSNGKDSFPSTRFKTPPQDSFGKTSIEGILHMNSRGKGFLAVDWQDDRIEVYPENTFTALHGNSVKAVFDSTTHFWKVTEIIDRPKKKYVGVGIKGERNPDEILLAPDDRRVNIPFRIVEGKIRENEKAFVELLSWDDPENIPEVKVLERIGEKGNNNVEMRSIILERGFEDAFPEEVEKEAIKIKQDASNDFQNEIPKRKDFRGTLTFTIDPDSAKDFDDALSFKKLDEGKYEIGIHIADVSHFVRPSTALDQEAQKRGTSVYLVDRTIPMLPEILSNDLCSLNPEEEKLAFGAIFVVNEHGEVSNRWFGKTIIRSNKRFTYENAQASIDNGGDYCEELRILNSIAKFLLKERFKKGAISFDSDEVKFVLDENGKPIRVFRKERLDTHKLVEEFMLLANRETATFVNTLDHGNTPLFVYRIHDVPDEEKMTSLAVFLRAIGYDLDIGKDGVDGKDINALFAKIEGKAEEGIIKVAAIRSMAKAIYSTQNIGHFGLAFKYYTHFTSPIRRYPDVLVHRLLLEYLEGRRIPSGQFAFYEKMAAKNTESEIRATDAERESIRLKQVEFMQERIGIELTGTISGVTEWGLYIEETETKAEGMVHVRNLGDDFYSLDQKNYCLVGERSKKKFSLGDAVRFKIIGADPERKTLDYALL